jgi:GTP cyclohydrolase II
MHPTPEIRFHRPGGRWGWLSPRSPHAVRFDGEHWPTAEHGLLAGRFVAGDPCRTAISVASLAEASRLAVRHRDRMRPDWTAVRDGVMFRAQMAKFAQHPSLAERLLATGHGLLVHHAHGLPYWADGGDGRGPNMLGCTLMAVREELRRARHPASAAD